MKKRILNKSFILLAFLGLVSFNVNGQSFTFDTTNETFTKQGNATIVDPQVTAGALTVQSGNAAVDQDFVTFQNSATTPIDVVANNFFKIRIKNPTNATQFKIRPDAAGGWLPTITLTPNSTEFLDYYVDFTGQANLVGSANIAMRFQFRPPTSGAVDDSAGFIEIDEITFSNTNLAPVAVNFADFSGAEGADNGSYGVIDPSANGNKNVTGWNFTNAVGYPNGKSAQFSDTQVYEGDYSVKITANQAAAAYAKSSYLGNGTSPAGSKFSTTSPTFLMIINVYLESGSPTLLQTNIKDASTANFNVIWNLTGLETGKWLRLAKEVTYAPGGTAVALAASQTNVRIYNPAGSDLDPIVLYLDGIEIMQSTEYKTTTAGGGWDASPSKFNGTGTPVATDVVFISNNISIYGGGMVAKKVFVDQDNSLTIKTGSTSLTTEELHTGASGSVVLEAGSSLIVTRVSSGNGKITSNIVANDTNWHLLSSPVVGATYNGTWIIDNDIDDTTGTVATNVAIGAYTNTVDPDGDWTYASDAANSGTFATGQGYSFKKDVVVASDISFTGSLKIDNLTSSIDQGTNNWNLKGNPYASSILVSDLLDDNTSNLTSTHKNVYVWNNDKVGGADYDALLTTAYISPGQGFFVNAANSDANNFTIDASKLTHQVAALYRAESNPSINLMVTSEEVNKSTEINFIANKTTGLDPSFDVGTFTGVSSNFSIYTQLVANNEGVNFMRQALPNSDFESMIVPVGVKVAAGKEITFTAEALNLPSGIKVFLEDRLTNTFTQLDEVNSEYKVVLDVALNGVGRFYLHTASSALSVDDSVLLNSVSIFKTNASTLRVAGLPNGKASISLFNILGKQVMTTSFEVNGNKDISLPKLATGVYFAKLQTVTGKLNKKIILE